jgi:hypothetical protein
MKGDNSRETFSKDKHYSAVRQQQGRVQVDADWNEQVAIQQHHDRTEATDVIGPVGAPDGDDGFEVVWNKSEYNGNSYPDLGIGAGRLYVDGILCEQDVSPTFYCSQPHLPKPPFTRRVDPSNPESPLCLDLGTDEGKLNPGTTYQVVADIWERHVSWVEDQHIREVALGGPDTATRVQTVWQVKITTGAYEDNREGTLSARTSPQETNDDLCSLTGATGYRGLENQLYRVEVHEGGTVDTGASYKWSRDNGSVVGRWVESVAEANTVRVEIAGGTVTERFQAGNWIELTGDARELAGRPGILAKLQRVYDDRLEYDPFSVIVPSDMTGLNTRTIAMSLMGAHPRVRRWDGYGLVVESWFGTGQSDNKWLPLEDGVEVHFWEIGGKYPQAHYHPGQYWLIPARTATRSIEWPLNAEGIADNLSARGITHHFAVLGQLTVVYGSNYELKAEVVDQRPIFCALTTIGCNGGSGDIPRPGQYRCYMVDPVNGSDETAVVGISDTSLAESISRARPHRFRTFTGLAARFPRTGNGSYATILIGPNAGDGMSVYQDTLRLDQMSGYAHVMIRASDLTGNDADWQNCLARRLTEFVVVQAGSGSNSVYVNLASGAPAPDTSGGWRGARVGFPGASQDSKRYCCLDRIVTVPTTGDAIANYQLVLASSFDSPFMPAAPQPGDRIIIDTQGVGVIGLSLSGGNSAVSVVGLQVAILDTLGDNDYRLAFVLARLQTTDTEQGTPGGYLSVTNEYSYRDYLHHVGPCMIQGSDTRDFASIKMRQALVCDRQVFQGPGRILFDECRITSSRSYSDHSLDEGLIVISGELSLTRGVLRGGVRLVSARATMRNVVLEPVPLDKDNGGNSITPPGGGDRVVRMSGAGSSLVAEGLTGGLSTSAVFVTMCPFGYWNQQGSAFVSSYNGLFVRSQGGFACIAYVEMADGKTYSEGTSHAEDSNGNRYVAP